MTFAGTENNRERGGRDLAASYIQRLPIYLTKPGFSMLRSMDIDAQDQPSLYCHSCGRLLFFAEWTKDGGRDIQARTRVTRILAADAGHRPVYNILHDIDEGAWDWSGEPRKGAFLLALGDRMLHLTDLKSSPWKPMHMSVREYIVWREEAYRIHWMSNCKEFPY